MSEQIITLSANAINKIKEIMSKAESSTIGVRVGVKSGGCAGMSYVMEYAKDIKPNEEVIENSGIKVLIDPKAIIYLLELKWIIKKKNFLLNLFLKILMKLKGVAVESLLKCSLIHCNTFQILSDAEYAQICKFLEISNQCKHQFDHQ